MLLPIFISSLPAEVGSPSYTESSSGEGVLDGNETLITKGSGLLVSDDLESGTDVSVRSFWRRILIKVNGSKYKRNSSNPIKHRWLNIAIGSITGLCSVVDINDNRLIGYVELVSEQSQLTLQVTRTDREDRVRR